MVSSTCPEKTVAGNIRQDQLDPGYHGIGLSVRSTILSATVIDAFVSSEDSTILAVFMGSSLRIPCPLSNTDLSREGWLSVETGVRRRVVGDGPRTAQKKV